MFVCGDITMAQGVEDALEAVLVKEGSLAKIEAREYIEKMKVGSCNGHIYQRRKKYNAKRETRVYNFFLAFVPVFFILPQLRWYSGRR